MTGLVAYIKKIKGDYSEVTESSEKIYSRKMTLSNLCSRKLHLIVVRQMNYLTCSFI